MQKVNDEILPLHQTKQPIISHAVQVIVIVSSYGCLMDPYCKCIVRIILLSSSISLFLSNTSNHKTSLHNFMLRSSIILFAWKFIHVPKKTHLFLTKNPNDQVCFECQQKQLTKCKWCSRRPDETTQRKIKSCKAIWNGWTSHFSTEIDTFQSCDEGHREWEHIEKGRMKSVPTHTLARLAVWNKMKKVDSTRHN